MRINHLRYADDTVLITDNIEDLRQMPDAINWKSLEYRQDQINGGLKVQHIVQL